MVLHPGQPQFVPTAEVKAFEQFVYSGNRNIVVLCSYNTGNILPAWAPVVVPLGLTTESVGINNLLPRIKTFYQTETKDSERRKLLDELGIDYVFWGPNEQELGQWDPNTVNFLKLFYQNGYYSIFKVKK